MKNLLIAGLLAIAGSLALSAQVATPPAASSLSSTATILVATSPVVGSACPSANLIELNMLTGDDFTCTNGTWLPNPSRLRTGLASNTDLAGSVTLSSGSGTYTFSGTYTSAPICVATDTTAANAVKTSASTTVLTLTGTTTDVLSYVCVARN